MRQVSKARLDSAVRDALAAERLGSPLAGTVATSRAYCDDAACTVAVLGRCEGGIGVDIVPTVAPCDVFRLWTGPRVGNIQDSHAILAVLEAAFKALAHQGEVVPFLALGVERIDGDRYRAYRPGAPDSVLVVTVKGATHVVAVAVSERVSSKVERAAIAWIGGVGAVRARSVELATGLAAGEVASSLGRAFGANWLDGMLVVGRNIQASCKEPTADA